MKITDYVYKYSFNMVNKAIKIIKYPVLLFPEHNVVTLIKKVGWNIDIPYNQLDKLNSKDEMFSLKEDSIEHYKELLTYSTETKIHYLTAKLVGIKESHIEYKEANNGNKDEDI